MRHQHNYTSKLPAPRPGQKGDIRISHQKVWCRALLVKATWLRQHASHLIPGPLCLDERYNRLGLLRANRGIVLEGEPLYAAIALSAGEMAQSVIIHGITIRNDTIRLSPNSRTSNIPASHAMVDLMDEAVFIPGQGYRQVFRAVDEVYMEQQVESHVKRCLKAGIQRIEADQIPERKQVFYVVD